MMQLRVVDLATSVDFYTKVVGLFEVGRTLDGRVLLKGYDEFDHHSLILRSAETAGMDFMGYKVASGAYLDYLAEKTKAFGLAVSETPANSDQPGVGRRISATLPTGHRVDFFADIEQSDPKPGTMNSELWTTEPRGAGAAAFDHALLFGPGAAETVRYFTEICGLAVTARGLKSDGNTLFTALSCASRAHDVAVFEFEQPGKLQHVAYRLNSWSDIFRAADVLTMHEVTIDAGPMRQGVTRGRTIYFFDPSGNRVELYAGDGSYYPDAPVRIWDYAHLGKGIFYYARQLNDNFFRVVS
jgi:catechol 2,3-dioxygenase